MFKRRNPKRWTAKFMSLLWPKNGWKRYGHYILLRLSRLKGTSRAIALGFACGVAVSFTPFVGFHLTLGAIMAFLMGGNVIASAIGTLIGNPWTFPVIWVSILYTGREMLKFLPFSYSAEEHIDFIKFFPELMKSIITFNGTLFVEHVWPILFPMLIGSIPYCLLAWLVSYFLIKNLLDGLKLSKEKKKNVK